MNEHEVKVDAEIGKTLERVNLEAPAPVSVDMIQRRAQSVSSPPARGLRFAAVVVCLAAACAAVVSLLLQTDPSSPLEQDAADQQGVAATDVVVDDQQLTSTSEASPQIQLEVEDGMWLSELIPEMAEQVPEVTEAQLWAELETSQPSWRHHPGQPDIALLGLTAARLQWEGMLIPSLLTDSRPDGLDTASVNAGSMIQRLHEAFVRTVDALDYDRAPELVNHTPYEVVVVASIIEAETRFASGTGSGVVAPDDRARIARVIYNRLEAELPLDIDSVISYGRQDRELEFTRLLLQTDGPYNSRMRWGLPPTPISSPGHESLQAAIQPTVGPWLFYVYDDSSGRYRFADDPVSFQAEIAALDDQQHDCRALYGQEPWLVLHSTDPRPGCVVVAEHQDIQVWNKGFDRLNIVWVDGERQLASDTSFSTGLIGSVLAPGEYNFEASPYPMPRIRVMARDRSPTVELALSDGRFGPVEVGMTLAAASEGLGLTIEPLDSGDPGCGLAVVAGDPYSPFFATNQTFDPDGADQEPYPSNPDEIVILAIAERQDDACGQ